MGRYSRIFAIGRKAKRALRNQLEKWAILWLTWRRRKELDEILRRDSASRGTMPEIVIFPPTVPWDIPLFQRPHQLALAMARKGRLVFFCEKPGNPTGGEGFRSIKPGLFVTDAPFDVFKRIPSPLVMALAYNRSYLARLKQPRIVYEYIDELEVLPGEPSELRRAHEELARTAHLAIATSEFLHQELLSIRRDALLCPNGVDDRFIRQAIAATQQPPDELSQFVAQGKPIIGYYGAMAKWLDYDLLMEVAVERPQYQFILIGPDYDGSIHPSRVDEAGNLLWLGPRPYPALPSYLKYFDAAIIPFKLNKVTHATSPLKLFEYLSAGKPVITTAMHECTRYPGILIAHNKDEFAQKIDEALQLRNDLAYLSEIERVAQENTWDNRAALILEALGQLGANL